MKKKMYLQLILFTDRLMLESCDDNVSLPLLSSPGSIELNLLYCPQEKTCYKYLINYLLHCTYLLAFLKLLKILVS